MNMMKIALLGTAALAVVSVSARADDLSDLKAQIEALNARVASVEAAPAVPAGFSLLTVGQTDAIVIPGQVNNKGYGAKAMQIGISPTADVAAASTVVQWSGFVRAALVFQSFESTAKDDSIDVKARGEIKVVGKTDTAVGEVGAQMKLRAQWENDSNSSNPSVSGGKGGTSSTSAGEFGLNRGSVLVSSPGAWGYWKMTPELTLGGGMDGSLAGNGFGYDGACNCYYTDNASAGYGHAGDPAQMRLSYASGPMSAAIALEDESNNLIGGSGALGVAAEIKYAGDTVSGELSGGYWGNDGTAAEAAYVVDIGMGFALGDMAKVSMSGGLGSGHGSADDFWKANILGSVNLSSAAHAEIGFNHLSRQGSNNDENSVLAGIYYDPVAQLTIGLEGEYIMNEGSNNDAASADLVTVFRF
jgi:hypothetical protein